MDTSIDLSFKSPLHKKVLEALNKRFTMSASRMSRLHQKWRKAEDQFVAYIPEKDVDALKRSARDNKGVQDYTTIVLPYTYSMLMSAHSYWTSVFLSRNPINQFSGRHGESEMQTQALEALIDYQVQVGRHILPLYFWLLDAGKFGIGIVHEYWCEENNYIARNVVTQKSFLGIPLGGSKAQIVSDMVPGYYGTKIFNVRPYDYYPDPRVPLWDTQRCEFVGYHGEVSWNEIFRKAASGEFIEKNCVYAKAKGFGGSNTGREPGSPRAELPNDGMSENAASDISDTGPYGVLTMYVDLIPSEWGLGPRDNPEKWVFNCITTGTTSQAIGSYGTLQVILGARPQGSYHNKFPFAITEMEPDAYNLITRGMPEISEPIQRSMDWLINSHMYNVRNALNNQFAIDPSRVVMSDFKNPTPGGGIRLRPSAYGTDIRSIIGQIPVQDVTRTHIGDMQYLDLFAQKALGVNEQIMGQINSGGRKTAAEIRTSSTFGVNRQKTISEFYSTMGFGPLAEILVQDSQQWYDGEMKIKIVGDLAQMAGPKFMTVTPDSIQGFFDFVPVDGTLPIDRFAQANLWKEILAGLPKMPQIAMQYDIAKIFAWTAQLAGLKNINQFRIQSQDPAAIAAQVQAGNLVPQGQGLSSGAQPNLEEPAQIPNLGPTA